LFIAPLPLRSSHPPSTESNLIIRGRPGTELFAPGTPVGDGVRASLARLVAQRASRSREEEGNKLQNSFFSFDEEVEEITLFCLNLVDLAVSGSNFAGAAKLY
jgi:hypothetical protein